MKEFIIVGTRETQPSVVLRSFVGAPGRTITSASQLKRYVGQAKSGQVVQWLTTPRLSMSAGRKKVHLALTKAMLDYIPKLIAKGVTVV